MNINSNDEYEKKVFDEGVEARHSGELEGENPHQIMDNEYRWWSDGWSSVEDLNAIND